MNTKKLKQLGLCALLSLSFSSCDKFLNVVPVGETTMPVLFSDMDGIRAAMPGVYAKTYDYYSSHFYLYPEIASDLLNVNLELAGARMNIYNFNSDPDNEAGPSSKIWQEILAALANINNALYYLPGLEEKYPQNREELAGYRAELLFLRALAHFDLCRSYAQPYNYTADAEHIGVPILTRTPGPEDNVDRQSVKKVYDFIIEDLTTAERILLQIPEQHSASMRPYYASTVAVQALLSRVFLYKEDWDQTISYADKATASMTLANGEDYLALYFNLEGAEKEMIFRLNGLDKSSSIFSFFNFRERKEDGIETYVLPSATPSNTFLTLFEDPEDTRNTNLLFSFDSRIVTRKFDAVQTEIESNRQHINPIILRLSEAYLNRAEAYIAKEQPALAAADIKAIHARALGKAVTDIELPETDLEAMTQIVYEERIRELAFEGHRLFDISRRKQNLVRDENTTSSVTELTYPSDYFVLPIPQRELDANPNMDGNPTVNN